MRLSFSFGFELDTSRPEVDPGEEPGLVGEVESQTYEVSETEGLYVNRLGFAPAGKERA